MKKLQMMHCTEDILWLRKEEEKRADRKVIIIPTKHVKHSKVQSYTYTHKTGGTCTHTVNIILITILSNSAMCRSNKII